jgi:CRP-like cAMP-binding protein
MINLIPPEEIEQFQNFIRTYPKGAQILVEGTSDNKGLILLRIGKVGIYKTVGNNVEHLSDIEAINFFGEMAIVSGNKRSATVTALSNEVVVYEFQKPNLQTLLSHPRWGTLLVRRLVDNLNEANQEILNLRKENRQTTQSLNNKNTSFVEVISAMLEIQNAITHDAVITAREWHYLKGFETFTRSMVKKNLPEIASKIQPLSRTKWEYILQETEIPKILDDYMREIIKSKSETDKR